MPREKSAFGIAERQFLTGQRKEGMTPVFFPSLRQPPPVRNEPIPVLVHPQFQFLLPVYEVNESISLLELRSRFPILRSWHTSRAERGIATRTLCREKERGGGEDYTHPPSSSSSSSSILILSHAQNWRLAGERRREVRREIILWNELG